jgi:hypothetical protein
MSYQTNKLSNGLIYCDKNVTIGEWLIKLYWL